MFHNLIGNLFKASRGGGKSRRALTSPDAAYRDWLNANEDRVRKFQEAKPVYLDAPRIAQQLSENGVVVATTDQFLTTEGRQAFVRAAELVLNISRSLEIQSIINQGSSDDKKDYIVRLVAANHEHAAESALLRMALDQKLLQIVSSYLGMWPRLHAIGAWLNFPTPDEAKQSQLWHRDPEDFRLVKAFIYLEDVDSDHGPFCYIPKTHPFGERAAVNPSVGHRKRITDEEMQAAIPAQDWLDCTGPAGTMILADTVGFHRGGKPKVGHRILITFTYTSGTPFAQGGPNIDGIPNWVSCEMQRYALSAGQANSLTL
jgi:hypothetical protein